MGEEVSIETLTRMVRKVVREELDRKDNQVALAVLKLVRDNMGMEKEKKPHEKRVITAE